MNINMLTIARPDDWHVHLRDGEMLAAVLPDTARQFARAIVMPNLKPPVRTTEDARAYRTRILAALPAGSAFEPLMTLYLTDQTTPTEIRAAHASGVVYAVKYYPAGATTHSELGLTDLAHAYPVFSMMQELGMPLLIHGEVTDPTVDIFDREAVFIERHLIPLMRDFPALKIVLEHITTLQAVDCVRHAPKNLAATITPHHLLYNRNALFQGGIRPHYYCLPVLKRERHRLALLAAATSGNPKFFLGTDSAPHRQYDKQSACGCAGMYSAHAAMELYAEAFDSVDALPSLEGFASHFGADFYGLPRNTASMTLIRESHTLPADIAVGTDKIIPMCAGETIAWKIQG
uniref:dihydroorotase n=1 Tax=mine drainage metagenome TaxID=410659 RepID=E6QUB5_9ZZZZ